MVAEQQAIVPRHRWGLGAFVVVEAAYLLSSVLLAMPFAGPGPTPISTILVVVGVPSILAASLAVLITRVRGNGPCMDLRLQWSWRGAGFGVLFGVAGL
ncbi:CPBP family intramembrane metalloprotease, partial [Mycobacterium sp. ITM-2017-0098]